MSTEVVSLKRSQIDAASEVLAQAFNADPMFSYFALEDEPARLDLINWVAKTILRYSQHYNHIYTTQHDLKGVAVWLPPTKYPLNNVRFLLSGLYRIPPRLRFDRFKQLIALFSKLEGYHQQDLPEKHWYLFMLGVAPTYQSQGIGSLLLQPILKQADREKLPCYLETSTEKGVRFYQRNGFEVLRSGTFPKTNLQYWTLKREPS
ncbi:GNAT family N-acetyltransferase [Gloeocapsopsis dulcis]|uniref:GNAT family N-acetyltransferase n=1 Tax=Gloeocapsopsis dulcis AAB1 = 1H9 TaxID=1433147 RepID=A0A6N8FSC8_9CHRO|nr:GNAT family N-acetyltransferase [Gloeocapsopsis dulcis]MUL35749.1 GNAT family N-acetyltransferase [Gloeocapsopsis dulcis AAB1 = 1H9]WNN90967.1 GNAT family N-acetyltransferase [Gloeocapsopsis dulcis]